jgi:arsenate reductase (thioredoxin)
MSTPNVKEVIRQKYGPKRITVESAGTKPGRVRPEAIAVMKQLGIDISGHRSKHVNKFQGQSFDYLLTVCDNAKESCPVFPGAPPFEFPLYAAQ